MRDYCPDGQRCESSACGGKDCIRFAPRNTATLTVDPCPTCPTLRAEISRLTKERDAAVRELERVRTIVREYIAEGEVTPKWDGWILKMLRRILNGGDDG